MNSEYSLEVTNLSKSFGTKKAVDNVSFNLKQGEFYAFLGANGAGKTTTMRMIMGLIKPDLGSIKVFGHDIETEDLKAKQLMAWLPDEPLIYDKLTPLEYFEFVAGLWNIDNVLAAKTADDLLKRFELYDDKDKRCEGFSRGMKQKTAIIGALLHDPKLLLLDEPFSGLDAGIARTLKDVLNEKTKTGSTIILTTHVMEIAERLAGKIAIINKGKIITSGTIEELRAAHNNNGSLEDIFLHLIDNGV